MMELGPVKKEDGSSPTTIISRPMLKLQRNLFAAHVDTASLEKKSLLRRELLICKDIYTLITQGHLQASGVNSHAPVSLQLAAIVRLIGAIAPKVTISLSTELLQLAKPKRVEEVKRLLQNAGLLPLLETSSPFPLKELKRTSTSTPSSEPRRKISRKSAIYGSSDLLVAASPATYGTTSPPFTPKV